MGGGRKQDKEAEGPGGAAVVVLVAAHYRPSAITREEALLHAVSVCTDCLPPAAFSMTIARDRDPGSQPAPKYTSELAAVLLWLLRLAEAGCWSAARALPMRVPRSWRGAACMSRNALVGFRHSCMCADRHALSQVMEEVGSRPYVVVFFNADADLPAIPDTTFLQELHTALDPSHRTRLKVLIILASLSNPRLAFIRWSSEQEQ